MRLRTLATMSAFGVLAAGSPLSAQQVISFEGLLDPFVPDGYAGFTWSGSANLFSWVVATSGGSGLHRPASGTANAWANGGAVLTMASSTSSSFDVTSVFLSLSGCQQPESETIHGSRNGTEVYSQTVALNCSAMQQYVLDFHDVDLVTFDRNDPAGGNLLLDDIAVGPATPVTATPEPATLSLMAIGLAGLAGVVRRSKKTSGDA